MNIYHNERFDNGFRSESEIMNNKILNNSDANKIDIDKMKDPYWNRTTKEKSTKFLVKYRDRVYNISSFLNYHPGGRNTLARLRDRVLDKALAEHPHSKSAYYLLEEFAEQRRKRYNECEVSDS